MKKIILFWGVGLMGWLLLAGCNSNDPGTAVQYINALNERDLETARSLVCPERQDDVAMGLISVADPVIEPFTFQNVSCSSRAGDVLCRFSIEQRTEEHIFTNEQFTREVVFKFEDGKVCGFEEQVAQ
ncbi:MAG: hypothetical protein R6X34_24645 [Chloroflexota bacterium]